MQLPELDWQFEDYLRALWLSKWLILLSTLVSWGCVTAYLSQKPNIYRATARVLIEAERARPVEFREMTPAADMFDQSYFLRTEYQIITSPPVLQQVVEGLNLAALPPFSGAEDPAGVLRGMISVEPVRGTKLVDISATGTDSQMITHVVNGVADSYVRLNLERRQETTTGGVQWLKDEVTKMEEKMRSDQTALQAFREEHSGLDFGTEQQNAILQRLEDLNTSITDTRKQRIDAEAKYRERHPVVRELFAKEMELQLALMEQEQQATQMNRLSIQYSALQREAKTSEEIYNTLLTRQKELSVEEGLQTNNVQVVSRAKVPRDPVSPNRARSASFATLLGLFLGGGLAILREATTKTLRNRREFDHVLEIPFLGHVPMIPQGRKRGGHERLILVDDPQSPAAEAIRAIRTTLEFLLPAEGSHVLVVTSALPEEGKSLICLNLAVAFQELGKKVVLVEADMRRPSLHHALDLQPEPCLSGYLQGRGSLQELVQVPAAEPRLPVIPSGPTPPQPADLLAGSKMQELIGLLKQQYQYILIDTPPVLAAADTTVLAKLAESTVYVVRAGRTDRDVVLAGRQRLVDVGARLLGGILNRAHLELEHGYRYYYYYKGSSRKRAAARPVPTTPSRAQEA